MKNAAFMIDEDATAWVPGHELHSGALDVHLLSVSPGRWFPIGWLNCEVLREHAHRLNPPIPIRQLPSTTPLTSAAREFSLSDVHRRRVAAKVKPPHGVPLWPTAATT